MNFNQTCTCEAASLCGNLDCPHFKKHEKNPTCEQQCKTMSDKKIKCKNCGDINE